MESPKSDAVELGGMKNYTVINIVIKVKIQSKVCYHQSNAF